MIIIWKWRYFKRKSKVVNTSLLMQAEFANACAQPNHFKDILFDEFAVCKQKPDGTTPLVKPAAKVVRAYVENELGDLSCSAFSFLENLIKFYKKDNTEVFVFLHRKDGFGDQEVEHIKQLKLANRCFLIGEGRDVIYYKREHYKGMLGQNGRFFRSESRPGSPSVRIANEQEKTIDLRYFIKVWNHYKHEFYSKILELKEDLLTHFYAIYPDEATWSSRRLREKLEEDSILKLRVINFIENDKIKLTKSEIDKLKEGEVEDKRSYTFDSVKANLKTLQSIEKEYSMVSNLLYEHFFKPATEDNSTSSVNSLLKKTEQSFFQLLEAIEKPA